jgi:hypothetical protein
LQISRSCYNSRYKIGTWRYATVTKIVQSNGRTRSSRKVKRRWGEAQMKQRGVLSSCMIWTTENLIYSLPHLYRILLSRAKHCNRSNRQRWKLSKMIIAEKMLRLRSVPGKGWGNSRENSTTYSLDYWKTPTIRKGWAVCHI